MPADRLRLAYLANPNETHTRRWLRWFAERGHEVTIVVAPEVSVEPGMPDGVRVAHWPPYESGRLKPLRYVAARRVLRPLFREIDPDVVHSHYLTTYGWLAWLAGARPYGITAWGSDLFFDLPASRRNAIFGRIALRGAAFVTADSRDLLRACVDAGARAERAAFVQFGVEVARFAAPPDPALRTRLGLDGRRVVFSPRTIMPLYNHEVVLRALAQLPEDVHLLMSARAAYPDELGRIEGLVAQLGLRDRTTVLDGIAYEEMAAHHRLADAVVSVPTTDGTPVTLFEAYAAGVPMIASDVPSLREWLGEVTPQFLVPVGDVAATARALREALDLDPAERAALSARLRAIAAEHGDHDRSMRNVEAMYRSAAEGRLQIPQALRYA